MLCPLLSLHEHIILQHEHFSSLKALKSLLSFFFILFYYLFPCCSSFVRALRGAAVSYSRTAAGTSTGQGGLGPCHSRIAIKAGRYGRTLPWEAFRGKVLLAPLLNGWGPEEKEGQLVTVLEHSIFFAQFICITEKQNSGNTASG